MQRSPFRRSALNSFAVQSPDHDAARFFLMQPRLMQPSFTIDVNYVLSITFVVGQTTRKSSSKSFYVPFTPLLRLRHVQEIPSHSKLKAHP